jgi:IclR family transcriptional regulator, KDG regulon repressor
MSEQKTQKDPSGYNVRAVERALQILECFDDEHPERGVSEIAQAVDLHKATTHRIMTTLLNFGYLERADDGQKYRLGIKLTELGLKVVRRMDLRREAHPFMKQLVQEWDETCDLSIFDSNNVFYVEVLRGGRALTIAAAVGQRLPAHCTASGKLFLAHLSPAELEVILSKPLVSFTEKTITSPDGLRKQLETIRSQGYAMDYEEFEVGVCAISAPIYNRQGKVIAAIGGPSPISRMTPERIQQMAAAFKDAAQEISRRMGWKP